MAERGGWGGGEGLSDWTTIRGRKEPEGRREKNRGRTQQRKKAGGRKLI